MKKKVLAITVATVLMLGVGLVMTGLVMTGLVMTGLVMTGLVGADTATESPCDEVLIFSDAGSRGGDNGISTLYWVCLDDAENKAILTPLPAYSGSLLADGQIPLDVVAAIAASPDGTKIYAIDNDSSALGIYDLSTSPPTWTLLPNPVRNSADFRIKEIALAACDPDIGTLYVVSNFHNRLFTVDTTTAITTPIDFITGAGETAKNDIAFDLAGTLYLYNNLETKHLYTVDPATAVATATPAVGPSAGFTGLALRNNGAGPHLVGSDYITDQIIVFSPDDDSDVTYYDAYLNGNRHDFWYGDMTIGTIEPCEEVCDSTCANSVYNYSQGTEKDGSAVQSGRSDPDNVLGSTDHDFFSLGFVTDGEGGWEEEGCWIIVEFEEYVGTCLTVVEQSPGTGYGYPVEQAKVYVIADYSDNPEDWTYLGIAHNQIAGGSQTGQSHLNTFELEQCIKFVKIIDITDPIPHGNTADAFDLDSVCAGPCTNQPPDCSEAYADLGCLWPPNHKFVDIGIEGVTDPDGDPVTITITGITSDEPTASDKGSGGVKHAPDAYGVGTDTATVRAERSGDGDGRVYVISFTASDGKGGECQGTVTVKVPHDQSDKTCPAVDSGQNYDATQIN